MITTYMIGSTLNPLDRIPQGQSLWIARKIDTPQARQDLLKNALAFNIEAVVIPTYALSTGVSFGDTAHFDLIGDAEELVRLIHTELQKQSGERGSGLKTVVYGGMF